MGRLVDAMFRGFVSGAADGMQDYLAMSSKTKTTETKVDVVASKNIPREQVDSPFKHCADHEPVGSKNKTAAENRARRDWVAHTTKEASLVKGSDRQLKISVGSEDKALQTSPLSNAIKNPPSTVEEEKIPPKALSTEEEKGSSSIKAIEEARNPNRPTPAEENHSPPIKAVDQDQSSPVLTNHPLPSLVNIVPPPIPSFDFMKNGIKTAVINARKEAGKDGSSGHKKMDLDKIVSQTRGNIVSQIEGLWFSNMAPVSDLTLKNIEAFIKSVAPQINAHSAAEVILLESGNTSSHWMEHAAKAAMKDIHQQNQGFRASLNQNREIVYSPSDASKPSRPPQQRSYDYDRIDRGRENEEANPYSPLGPPGSVQMSSSESNRDNNIGIVGQKEIAENDTISLKNYDNDTKPLKDMIWDAGEIVINQDVGSFVREIHHNIIEPAVDALGKEVLSGKEWP